MSKIEQPSNAHIRELTRAEIDAILGRNNVGRIAFSFHDRVDIEPINYAYTDGWIYGRTSHGSKIDTIAHHMWVAFEVDEVAGIFDWRSVVVKGAFYLMNPSKPGHRDASDASARQDPSFAQGVALLRSIVPDTLLSADPAPYRHAVFRIHLDEVTGREAVPVQRAGAGREP
jgi:nitroimidazol reductase NimA-like FMN-containing flavoprotein (pyridoxamine 5'-phosphate oxidase superfamily)